MSLVGFIGKKTLTYIAQDRKCRKRQLQTTTVEGAIPRVWRNIPLYICFLTYTYFPSKIPSTHTSRLHLFHPRSSSHTFTHSTSHTTRSLTRNVMAQMCGFEHVKTDMFVPFQIPLTMGTSNLFNPHFSLLAHIYSYNPPSKHLVFQMVTREIVVLCYSFARRKKMGLSQRISRALNHHH